jgi:hypothetical protein
MFHSHRSHRRSLATLTTRLSRGEWFGWLRPLFVPMLLVASGTLGNMASELSLPSAAAQQQMVQPAGTANPLPAKELPLDQPLMMIAEARKAYLQVNDYQCILISQERVKGKLLPECIIQMTFRKNPFSVHMKWLGPKEEAGQEVCFVQGRNQNKMRVLPAGFAKGFGWTSIDLNDPRVMQHSRHTLSEAGFGNLIERCAKCWEAERLLGKTQVQMADYEYNKQRCLRIETVHTAKDPSFYCYRSVIYFDNKTWLPVRMECYDWPHAGGPPEGELLECFSYVNLQFNLNPPDTVFNH